MNEGTTIQTAAPAAPPPAELPERTLAMLDRLTEAQEIAMRSLRKMDRLSEDMPPEEAKVALAEKGQLTLNMTRTLRALRQLGVLQEEVMGRREPALPRGPGGSGGGNGGSHPGRHDFNDLNDLNDLRDREQEELRALFDLDDREDAKHWDDMEALEKYDTYDEYLRRRKHYLLFTEDDEEELDRRLRAELDKIDWDKVKPISIEQKQANIREMEERFAAESAEHDRMEEAKWLQRREALLKLRDTEKRLARKSRGPPRR